MLQTASFLAIVAVDTAENEPSKVRQFDSWVRCNIGRKPPSPERQRRRPRRKQRLGPSAQPNENPSPRHITLSEARSRLYQHRSWPPNSHFAAFFKIYKICILLHRSELKFLEKIIQNFQKFCKFCENIEILKKNMIFSQNHENFNELLQNFEIRAA